MIKKLGVVTVGVAAGLMAAAPFASASEGHGHGHEHGHGQEHGQEHGQKHGDSGSCNVTGGDATANGGIDGDALANVVAQVPVGGANAANIVCNDILNDNVSGNDLDVNVLSSAPEVPIELPEAPAAGTPAGTPAGASA